MHVNIPMQKYPHMKTCEAGVVQWRSAQCVWLKTLWLIPPKQYSLLLPPTHFVAVPYSVIALVIFIVSSWPWSQPSFLPPPAIGISGTLPKWNPPLQRVYRPHPSSLPPNKLWQWSCFTVQIWSYLIPMPVNGNCVKTESCSSGEEGMTDGSFASSAA